MGELSSNNVVGPPGGNFDPPGNGPFDEPQSEPRKFVPGNLLVFLQQQDDETELSDDEIIGLIINQIEQIETEFDDIDIRDTQVITLGSVKIAVLMTSVVSVEEDAWETFTEDLCDQLASLEEFAQYIVNCSTDTLMSGAPNETPPPDQGGGGGPGSKPVEPADVDDENVFSQVNCGELLSAPNAPWDFDLDGSQQGSEWGTLDKAHGNRTVHGASVTVIILDTIPPETANNRTNSANHLSSRFSCPGMGSPNVPAGPLLDNMCRSMEDAAALWSDTNPLVSCLFDQQGVLQLYYNPDFDRDPHDGNPLCDSTVHHVKHDRRVGVDEYPYFAMDHGPFIAGIIHTLAPNADLHLVETLNAYAQGSLSTFATALGTTLDILRNIPSTNVIVNASLIFDYSLDPAILQIPVLDFINEVNLLEHRLLMFAAAGNDSSTQTRLPAASAEFHAVAALNRGSSALADYSNLGEFAAWGGQINPDHSTGQLVNLADEADGILGVYIGEYPNTAVLPGNPPPWVPAGGNFPPNSRGFTNVLTNSTGWARWAGTSFATPILTGCAAQLVNDGVAFGNVLKVLRGAFAAKSDNGEHCVWMWQL